MLQGVLRWGQGRKNRVRLAAYKFVIKLFFGEASRKGVHPDWPPKIARIGAP